MSLCSNRNRYIILVLPWLPQTFLKWEFPDGKLRTRNWDSLHHTPVDRPAEALVITDARRSAGNGGRLHPLATKLEELKHTQN